MKVWAITELVKDGRDAYYHDVFVGLAGSELDALALVERVTDLLDIERLEIAPEFGTVSRVATVPNIEWVKGPKRWGPVERGTREDIRQTWRIEEFTLADQPTPDELAVREKFERASCQGECSEFGDPL